MTKFARVRALVSAATLAAVGMVLAAATVLAGSGPGPFPH